MDWQDILLGFVLNGVVILIFRAIIESAHAKDMAAIEHRNSEALARLNADLARLETLQATRFRELHQRRAVTIAELYKLVARAERRLDRARIPTPYIGDGTKSGWDKAWEKLKPTYAAVEDVVEYYAENKIFLTPDQAALMDKIIDVFDDVESSLTGRELHIHTGPEDEEARKATWERIAQRLSAAYDELAHVYPDLKKQLEDSFRAILGAEIYDSIASA